MSSRVCLSQGLANRAFSRSTPRRLWHLCLVEGREGRVPKRVLSGWQDEAEVWGYPRPVKLRSTKDLWKRSFRPLSPSWFEREDPTWPYSTGTSVIHHSYPFFFMLFICHICSCYLHWCWAEHKASTTQKWLGGRQDLAGLVGEKTLPRWETSRFRTFLPWESFRNFFWIYFSLSLPMLSWST